MDRIFSVNLLWGLVPVTGIIIGGALWLYRRRDRLATASIEPEARVPAISADELPMSESDPDRDRSIVIEETEDDDDAEPPYISWFY
ncbi:hypothetical protein [Chamaesiphon sp.]|uniref:hypothetical protein n=1 Tax=Chamaesiphon sp. TaxID=2814140 RepID=UPI003593F3D8